MKEADRRSSAATDETTVAETSEDFAKLHRAVSHAVTLLQEKRPAEALACLTPFESIDAPFRDFHYILGVCLVNGGEYQRAQKALARELLHFPDNERALDMLCAVLCDIGQGATLGQGRHAGGTDHERTK